jgi:hypothetical protein
MKAQSWESWNPWYGEKNEKKMPLKKLRGHTQTSLLWACQI